MESEAISQDIEALERDLLSLRSRVEGDSSSFATLEQQVAELRESLLRTREGVAEREARLAEKRQELAEAQRLEALAAYEDDLRSQREAADQAASAATDFLAALDAYDDETLKLRSILEEMRGAFGSDERVSQVEQVLQDWQARLKEINKKRADAFAEAKKNEDKAARRQMETAATDEWNQQFTQLKNER